MKAVVYRGVEDLRLEDVPKPKIERASDAIIRVTTASICGSDIHMKHHGDAIGVFPGTTLGHEYVGVIEELGDTVTDFLPGDRVAVSCIFSCGQCYYCQKGLYSQCPSGSVFGGKGKESIGGLNHGCHTNFVRVPYASSRVLQKIPDSLADEDVLFVGDILSTGYIGAERGEIQPDDTVVIVGAGPVGMCAAIGARLFGAAQIVMLDTDAHRLKVSEDKGLAEVIINISTQNPRQTILDITAGRGADVVIDAVGSKQSFEDAFTYVRPGGTVSLLGVYTTEATFYINKYWRSNLTVKMGLVEVNRMGALIEMIAKGKIDTKFLITHTFDFSQVMEAYEVMDKRLDNVIKVALKM